MKTWALKRICIMHMVTFLTLFSGIISYVSVLKAQNPEWIVYNCSNMPSSICSHSIYSFTIDKYSNKWIFIDTNIVKFDDISFTVIPVPAVPYSYYEPYSCRADTNGGIWFSHYDGMGVFSNNSFSFYDIFYNFYSFDIDNYNRLIISSTYQHQTLWITMEIRKTEDFTYLGIYPGPYNPGIIKCLKNNDTWINDYYGQKLIRVRDSVITFYDTSYTHTQFIHFWDASSDTNKNAWFAYRDYIAMFDDIQFFVYDSTNSCVKLPARSIACDLDNIVWIGTESGLVKFDGANCDTYNTDNSPLPYNKIFQIIVDNFNNKWILSGIRGTQDINLVVYREGGVMLNAPENYYSKEKNVVVYPNPASTELKVRMREENGWENKIELFDIQGRIMLSNITKEPETVLDISQLPAGVYYCVVSNEKYRETVKVVKM